jgi:hypothetical protein
MNAAAETIEVTKEAVTAGSIYNHLKNNRLEYLLGIALLHLLGVSDAVISRVSGVCF